MTTYMRACHVIQGQNVILWHSKKEQNTVMSHYEVQEGIKKVYVTITYIGVCHYNIYGALMLD